MSPERKQFDLEERFESVRDKYIKELKRSRQKKFGIAKFEHRTVLVRKDGVFYGNFKGIEYVPPQTARSVVGLFALAMNPKRFLSELKGSVIDTNTQIEMKATKYSRNNDGLQLVVLNLLDEGLKEAKKLPTSRG